MDFAKIIEEFENGILQLPGSTNENENVLLKPQFISYFLDYLRTSTDHFHVTAANDVSKETEKSLSKIYTSQISTASNSTKNRSMNYNRRRDNKDIQRMSTPKYNDGVISPLPRNHTSSCQHPQRRNSPKHRPKNNTVGDFLLDSMVTRSLPRNKKQTRNKNVKTDTNRRRSAPHDFKHLQQSNVTRAINFDIKDAGEFPQLKTPATDDSKKATRRIKPTTVQLSTPVKFASHIAENSMNDNPFAESAIVTRHSSPMTTGKENVAEVTSSLSATNLNGSLLPDISPVKREDIVASPTKYPDPKAVTRLDEIKRLSSLYSFYITNLLVASLVAEVNFIIQLLSDAILFTKQKTVADSHNDTITGSLCTSDESIHNGAFSNSANAVSFCVFTLEALQGSKVITLLGQSSMKMLADNICVKTFSPILHANLLKITSEEHVTKHQSISHTSNFLSSSAVPFEPDTDERSSFASDRAFRSYRKQRDTFYDIIRDYERGSNDFKSNESICTKIRGLISTVKSFSTFNHFARLFVSQLLLVIDDNNHSTVELEQSSMHDGLLESLKLNNPNKFRMLQSRFVSSKSTKRDYCAFNKSSFFKEFIEICDSHLFNMYLTNEIEARLTEHQSQHSMIYENIESESMPLASCHEKLSKIIFSLHLLAKFYGYLCFHPFTDISLPLPLHLSELTFVMTSVTNARLKGHLVVTIPWVSEFMTFAPSNLMNSKQFCGLLDELCVVYRYQNSCSSVGIFISSCISRLFERYPVYNDYYYTNMASNRCHDTVAMHTNTLDAIMHDDIDLTMLNDLHHSLRSIRSCLAACNQGVTTGNERTNVRKIKPSTTTNVKDSSKTRNNIQLSLEEQFFKGQPSSLKRIVTFVGERVSSNCVKFIRSKFMLDVCDEAEAMYKEKMKTDDDLKQRKTKINCVVTAMQEEVRSRVTVVVETFCNEQSKICMNDLTSCETDGQVLCHATDVAIRHSIENTLSWLRNNIDNLVSLSVKARIAKVNYAVQSKDKFLSYNKSTAQFNGISSTVVITSYSNYLHTVKEVLAQHFIKDLPNFETIDGNVCCLTSCDHWYLLQVGEALLQHNEDDIDQLLHNNTHLKDILTLIKEHAHLHNTLHMVVSQLKALLTSS